MPSTDIDGRILKALEGHRYLSHRNDERDYSYRCNGSVCIEALDASGESGLIIDRDSEYTLSFGYHHEHYSMEDEADICELAETVSGILHNRICAVSIVHRTKGNRFVLKGSCFVASDQAETKDVEALCQEAGLCFGIRRSNEMMLEYWDSSKNKSIQIHRNKNRSGRQHSSFGLIIFLALFHWYFCHFIFFALVFLIARSKRQLVLLLGLHCLLFAIYSYIGYVFRWKHIYCSYQNANHVRMTPSNRIASRSRSSLQSLASLL